MINPDIRVVYKCHDERPGPENCRVAIVVNDRTFVNPTWLTEDSAHQLASELAQQLRVSLSRK